MPLEAFDFMAKAKQILKFRLFETRVLQVGHILIQILPNSMMGCAAQRKLRTGPVVALRDGRTDGWSFLKNPFTGLFALPWPSFDALL